MSLVYELIGRIVVKLGISYTRRRYGRHLVIAAVVAVLAAVAGGYALSARGGVREA